MGQAAAGVSRPGVASSPAKGETVEGGGGGWVVWQDGWAAGVPGTCQRSLPALM